MHVDMGLEHVDGRQKALTLQTILIEILRAVDWRSSPSVTPRRNRLFEQSRKNHGVADVGDEKPRPGKSRARAIRHPLRDDIQRLCMLFDGREFGMHVAHEMIEVAGVSPSRTCRKK